MARPREFDEAQVLDAAIDCFWSHGYEAASVRDLAGRMGITGASLYNAFGDKRALFRRALDRYLDGGLRANIARHAQAATPYLALTGYLADTADKAARDVDGRGCFLINSVLEASERDPEFRDLTADALGELETFFHDTIVRGQQDGSISTRQDAQSLARLLLGVQVGLRVLGRARPDRAALESMLAPVRDLLRP